MDLSDELVANVTHVLGDRGRQWLDALPSLLASCEADYGLRIGEPFELSYNYVAGVTLADGTDAVLKLSPHGQDFHHELTATRHFDGRGMARLFAADETRGIALLERLRPGSMLVDLEDDDRRTEIAADVMLELRAAPAVNTDVELPTASDRFAAFARHRSEHGGSGPLPPDLFERGEATYSDLLQSDAGPSVILHGDLHHYNILSATRAPWLAIDPHGVLGEPAFETGAYFGNPLDLLSSPDAERMIRRRVDIFADRLHIDRARIIGWGLAYQMLSAVWSAENQGTGWQRAIGVAQILAALQ